nr:NAD(P)/FAD-dependent oxidoreductase [Psychrobacter sp. YP14]
MPIFSPINRLIPVLTASNTADDSAAPLGLASMRTQYLPQLPALPNLPKRAAASARRLLPVLPFNKKPDFEVLIIGAGVSGIATASHLQRDKLLSPLITHKKVAIVEKRAAIGGTWDLFKYPGIRSDSDMTTFGFAHRPWLGKKTLADAASIKRYIEDTATEENLQPLIQFNTEVSALNWSSRHQYWQAQLTDVTTGQTRHITARFVIGATGYYDYDAGYQPVFKGQQAFNGKIVHPQLWDETIDYDNKRVVVIGSGATAVTLVPALLSRDAYLASASPAKPQVAAQVIMLQRSPTYIASIPSEDPSYVLLTERFKLPPNAAYGLVRGRNILLQQSLYRLSRVAPKLLKTILTQRNKYALKGSGVALNHFVPDYNPWDERLCAVPDGDLFKAMHTGHADVVTDHIDHFTKDGIQLASGRHLPADIIITATGLKLQMLGGAKLTIDGKALDVSARMSYKAVLLEGVPNMAVLFGYTNASWTLKIDLAAAYLTRLLRHMHHYGYKSVIPDAVATDGEQANRLPDTVMGSLSAGYIQRAQNTLPKQGDRYPWYVTNNYLSDRMMLKQHRVHDKWLRFGR